MIRLLGRAFDWVHENEVAAFLIAVGTVVLITMWGL